MPSMNPSSSRVRVRRKTSGFYALCFKRITDAFCAFLALASLLWLLLPIIFILLIVYRGNPFFVQQRIGRYGKPFNIVKFRTMSNERGANGELLPDEERTTCFGRFLRSTSLDELPELLNVLRGDMSFIGPRPWIPQQMNTFRPSTQQRRMLVRPGMSGLAQIRGRNDLTFRQRVCYDLYYIRHLSLRLDAQILFYTLYKVVLREGIHQRPDALAKRCHANAPKDPGTRGRRGNNPGAQPLVYH